VIDMKFARPSVKPVSLGELAQKFNLQTSNSGQKITGITHNTKSVEPGDLFVALNGEKNHGAQFVAEAKANGAVAVLTDSQGKKLITDKDLTIVNIENPRHKLGEISAFVFGNPSESLKVFGITGTNGKTTSAWLMRAGLEKSGIPTSLLGTAGISIAGVNLPSARTTPEAPELQALLALALEKGSKAVSMEVSSHALDLERVNGTKFVCTGFTNLSQDHLDFHKNMESYFESKAKLFTQEFSSKAVITELDTWSKKLIGKIQIPFVTLGGDVHNDWRVSDITAALGHVYDYAHTPEAIDNVLSALKKQTHGKLIVVLGAGGNRDSEKRPFMGSAGEKFADKLIITDDNPRDENPAEIRKAVLSGVKNQTNSLEIGSREEAIREAVKLATPDDTIAILGKGHETTQEIAGKIIEFDDAKHLHNALKEKFGH